MHERIERLRAEPIGLVSGIHQPGLRVMHDRVIGACRRGAAGTAVHACEIETVDCDYDYEDDNGMQHERQPCPDSTTN